MTIKVTVKNEDTRETAIIGVRQMGKTGIQMEPDSQNGPRVELKGGESTEVYVHSHQYLVVDEISQ